MPTVAEYIHQCSYDTSQCEISKMVDAYFTPPSTSEASERFVRDLLLAQESEDGTDVRSLAKERFTDYQDAAKKALWNALNGVFNFGGVEEMKRSMLSDADRCSGAAQLLLQEGNDRGALNALCRAVGALSCVGLKPIGDCDEGGLEISP